MSLETATIDSVKTQLSKGIKIESGNGITQQIAKAAGIQLENGKLVSDKQTRNFLIELAKTISTTDGALTPSRPSKMKHGFSAAHTVQEGDIITLADASIDAAATLAKVAAPAAPAAPAAAPAAPAAPAKVAAAPTDTPAQKVEKAKNGVLPMLEGIGIKGVTFGKPEKDGKVFSTDFNIGKRNKLSLMINEEGDIRVFDGNNLVRKDGTMDANEPRTVTVEDVKQALQAIQKSEKTAPATAAPAAPAEKVGNLTLTQAQSATRTAINTGVLAGITGWKESVDKGYIYATVNINKRELQIGIGSSGLMFGFVGDAPILDKAGKLGKDGDKASQLSKEDMLAAITVITAVKLAPAAAAVPASAVKPVQPDTPAPKAPATSA